MAEIKFEAAFGKLMRWEINSKLKDGFYSIDPDDPGGETYKGIARNRKPGSSWAGWAKIDELKDLPDFPQILLVDPEIDQMAEDFYRENFWNPLYERLNDQTLANRLFQFSVNSGEKTAIGALQKALRHLKQPVVVDGKLGPETLKFAGLVSFKQLLDELKARQAFHYLRWILRKPQRRMKYALGLLRRAIED